jgi:hypothetical protein
MDARLRSAGMIAVFYIAAPLVTYSELRSHGFSMVTALVLSGVFPGAGLIIDVFRHRRVDAVGAVVLAGIVAGAILALAFHSAKPVLDEGSVGTAVFGLMCLGSLATTKPFMYRLVLEFMGGEGSEKGREFAGYQQDAEFRHAFRVITAVWGAAFLAEAVARVIIVQETAAGTAFATSTVMPFAVGGAVSAWTIVYGRYSKRRAIRLATAAAAGAPGVRSGDVSLPEGLPTEHPLPERTLLTQGNPRQDRNRQHAIFGRRRAALAAQRRDHRAAHAHRDAPRQIRDQESE